MNQIVIYVGYDGKCMLLLLFYIHTNIVGYNCAAKLAWYMDNFLILTPFQRIFHPHEQARSQQLVFRGKGGTITDFVKFCMNLKEFNHFSFFLGGRHVPPHAPLGYGLVVRVSFKEGVGSGGVNP